MVGHSKWLEGLQEDRWTLLTDFTHHIHRPFKAGDARLDIQVGLLGELLDDFASNQTDELQMQILNLLANVTNTLLALPLNADFEHVGVLMLCYASYAS